MAKVAKLLSHPHLLSCPVILKGKSEGSVTNYSRVVRNVTESVFIALTFWRKLSASLWFILFTALIDIVGCIRTPQQLYPGVG